jgi:hypothetical protein
MEQTVHGQGPRQIPVWQCRELPAMAPLHDPVFQRDIRTIPINGTRNVCEPDQALIPAEADKEV